MFHHYIPICNGANVFETSLWTEFLYMFSYYSIQRQTFHSVWKQYLIFHKFFNNKKMVFIDSWDIVSHAFLCLFKAHEKYKSGHLKKMENPFVDESFMVPDTTEAISTFCLRQKLKRDKIVSL